MNIPPNITVGKLYTAPHRLDVYDRVGDRLQFHGEALLEDQPFVVLDVLDPEFSFGYHHDTLDGVGGAHQVRVLMPTGQTKWLFVYWKELCALNQVITSSPKENHDLANQ